LEEAFSNHNLEALIIKGLNLCRNGSAEAQRSLGWEHLREAGNADAQWMIGLLLLEQAPDYIRPADTGVKHLRPAALRWLRKSAEQGHASAVLALAEAYQDETLSLAGHGDIDAWCFGQPLAMALRSVCYVLLSGQHPKWMVVKDEACTNELMERFQTHPKQAQAGLRMATSLAAHWREGKRMPDKQLANMLFKTYYTNSTS
jgi:TPR repeat protein